MKISPNLFRLSPRLIVLGVIVVVLAGGVAIGIASSESHRLAASEPAISPMTLNQASVPASSPAPASTPQPSPTVAPVATTKPVATAKPAASTRPAAPISTPAVRPSTFLQLKMANTSAWLTTDGSSSTGYILMWHPHARPDYNELYQLNMAGSAVIPPNQTSFFIGNINFHYDLTGIYNYDFTACVNVNGSCGLTSNTVYYNLGPQL